MNKKKIIRLLRQADAGQIAENWPHPDKETGERIYAGVRRSAGLPAPEDVVQDEVIIEKHSGAGRFAAVAAVCLLTVGTVGGIGLLQHLHKLPPQEPPSAEQEQLVSDDAPTESEAPAVTAYVQDPAATDAADPAESNAAAEPASEQAAADASEPASTTPAKSTTPATTEAEKDTAAPTEAATAGTDLQAKRDRAYELLVEFAAAHEYMEVYRTAREYFEGKMEVGLASGKYLDEWVLVVYPWNFANAYQPEFKRFLQENQIGDCATDYQSEPVYTEARITLAEAEHICRESDTAWKAAECIEQRYAADERFGSGVEFDTYYIDDAKTESINILYNGGIIIFYKSPQESAGMTAQNHRILTAAGQQVWTLLEWQRTEMGKSDSVLTEEQKAQLRALDEEEKSLWATTYIRRRLEIMGAMSPNAPRPTIEDVERLLAQSDSPGQAARNLQDLYVPDYEWGSGVYGLAYQLSDTETINIVESQGASIFYENTATGERRDFCE